MPDFQVFKWKLSLIVNFDLMSKCPDAQMVNSLIIYAMYSIDWIFSPKYLRGKIQILTLQQIDLLSGVKLFELFSKSYVPLSTFSSILAVFVGYIFVF